MRKLISIISVLLAAFALCACGEEAVIEEPIPVIELSGGSFNADVEELSVVIAKDDIPLLDGFTALKRADFSGSDCAEELFDWSTRNSSVEVTYTLTLPDGTVCDNHLASLDLTGKNNTADYIPALRLLPELRHISLSPELSFEDVSELANAAPNAVIDYAFTLYGREINAADESINLSHVRLDDEGAEVMRALSVMRACTFVDMDSCGVDNEHMAEIRDAYPAVKVVWRIWFGTNYSVRTDVTKILASSTHPLDQLTPDNTTGLQYCTEVTHLDLGHNPNLTDISFVACMPKLQVFIIALDGVEDISPLANCPELEYAELYFTKLVDVSPLAGLTNLRHLNIGGNEELCDISPLYGLTGLERLWIGRYDPVPEEQIAAMQAAAPNCEINLTSWDPMDDGWRFLSFNPDVRAPRYEKLREEFRYSDGLSAYSYSFNDPLY